MAFIIMYALTEGIITGVFIIKGNRVAITTVMPQICFPHKVQCQIIVPHNNLFGQTHSDSTLSQWTTEKKLYLQHQA